MIQQTVTCLKGEAVVLNCVLDPVVGAGIAGWTIQFGLKQNYSDVALLINQTMAITDVSACTFTTTLTHTSTNITPGTYYFDIWRTDSGHETPLIAGPFIINSDVRY
jgi:hypothetical protein